MTDLCKSCSWFKLTPPENTECVLHWPGKMEGDVCVSCESYRWCLPTTNWNVWSPITNRDLTRLLYNHLPGDECHIVIKKDALKHIMGLAHKIMVIRAKPSPSANEWEEVAECEEEIANTIMDFLP